MAHNIVSAPHWKTKTLIATLTYASSAGAESTCGVARAMDQVACGGRDRASPIAKQLAHAAPPTSRGHALRRLPVLLLLHSPQVNASLASSESGVV